MLLIVFVVFFFMKNTAYVMRISDWSSDVCSSDLQGLSHSYLRSYYVRTRDDPSAWIQPHVLFCFSRERITIPSSGVFAKCDPVQSSRTPTRSGRSSASAGQLFLTVQQDASRHWASCNLRFPTLPSEAGGMRHAPRW